MQIPIFIYNIILIVLYTVVLTFSVFNYRQKKRPLFAAMAVLFLFYIFDNVIIYMTEFLDGFSMHYDLQFMSVPAFKTLIFLTTNFCLATIQWLVLTGRRQVRDIWALVILGLSLLFIPLAGNGALKVWLYYLPAQLFTLYLSLSGLVYLKKHPDALDQEMSSYRMLLWITLVFSLLILLEDTVVIFSFDVYSDILVKINNRSVSEDVLSIIYSFYAIRYLTREIQVPQVETGADECGAGDEMESGGTGETAGQVVPEPAAGQNDTAVQMAVGSVTGRSGISGTAAAADMAAPMASGAGVNGPAAGTAAPQPESANTAFLHFVNHYQLTSREQDILRVLLMDRNNQEISDALYISIGTVKTHVHNIFQKVNVTKRSQLLKIYYEYQKDMPWL